MKRDGGSGRLFDVVWFLAWALASSAWCVTAAAQLSATFDEPFYIARGLEFWRTGSHGGLLEKGTMPLPVDLYTLPLYLWERWQGIQLDPTSDLDHLLPWARAGTLAFWWLLLAYGWRTGHHLAGPWGGRLAVAMLACEPTFLAHAKLATSDIAISACLLALVYHFRTGREAGWMRRVGIPAFWFGSAILSKASGLMFGPLCLLVVELERLVRAGAFRSVAMSAGRWASLLDGLDRLRPFKRDAMQVIGCGLALVFVYCGSDWKQEPSFVEWAHGLPEGKFGGSMVWLAENLRIFTNAGQALVKQIQHNVRGHGVFLLGEVGRRAFWYYFPVALTMKLSLLPLLMPVVVAALRPRALANWALLSAAALLAFSLTYRVQNGVRLVLPLVALALVGLAGAVVQAFRESASGWRRGVLAAGAGAGIIWTAAAAVVVWPHGLCYTNELWGGTPRGYLLLSDSNYDWGQGLKELARWQRLDGRGPLDVWYFGTDPMLRSLPLREVRFDMPSIRGPEDVIARVRGHYLAVGTTWLYGAYIPVDRQQRYAFLRARRPVARTMTFMIYDFTQE